MKLSDIAKRMIKVILIISLICITGSIIYYRSTEFLPFLYGVLLGGLTSILKVYLLDRSLDKSLAMEEKKAISYLTLQNIIRMILSGLALVIGALVPLISIWGVAAGILAFSLAAYSEKFRTKN